MSKRAIEMITDEDLSLINEKSDHAKRATLLTSSEMSRVNRRHPNHPPGICYSEAYYDNFVLNKSCKANSTVFHENPFGWMLYNPKEDAPMLDRSSTQFIKSITFNKFQEARESDFHDFSSEVLQDSQQEYEDLERLKLKEDLSKMTPKERNKVIRNLSLKSRRSMLE